MHISPPPNYTPRADDNAHEPFWTYLFNFIPPSQSTKLQNLAVCFIIIGVVAMGIEGEILGKADDL